MKNKKIKNNIAGAIILSLLLNPAISYAQMTNQTNQNSNQIQNNRNFESNKQYIPDHINYYKLNQSRECSPAEKYLGKTNCGICDPDTPNIVTSYRDSRAISAGGVTVTGALNASEYDGTFKGIHGGANSKNDYLRVRATTIKNNSNFPRYNSDRYDNSYDRTPYTLLKGYNLSGISEHFKPLNKRTMCETLRPPAGVQEKDGSLAMIGMLAGIAGTTIASGALNKITDASGNAGRGMAIFDKSKSTGSNFEKMKSAMSSSTGKGVAISFISTEAFACLEYYTGTNMSMDGGDHLRANKNPQMAQKCKQPMQTFYNTKMAELWCYSSPCDGQADGAFKPVTILMRQIFLMTNPYIMYGQTLPQSIRIAQQRPMMCYTC